MSNTSDASDKMQLLKTFFTLQKIANWGPPPSMMLLPSSVEVYRLPPGTTRLRNTVLGFGEDDPDVAQDSVSTQTVMLLALDLDE
jgi:hypothetical protein